MRNFTTSRDRVQGRSVRRAPSTGVGALLGLTGAAIGTLYVGPIGMTHLVLALAG